MQWGEEGGEQVKLTAGISAEVPGTAINKYVLQTVSPRLAVAVAVVF